MYNDLLFNIADGRATITLNRPGVYNAFNNEMSFELQAAIKEATKNPEVRVVVLTGEGKAFCSGQDLKASSQDPSRSFRWSVENRYNPIIMGLRNMPKPVICRLNGVAAGAGASVALACDYIVASEESSLIEVFINIGLVPDSGSSYFLPRTVGMKKAFELCTTGQKIKAPEALELGLVNKVVPHDELDNATNEIATFYAKAPTKAIGMIKKMLIKAETASLEEILQYEAYCQEIAGSTEDHKEGVQAFIEKRTPEFKGK